jgi:ribose 5-phosphate isomerase B
MRIAVGADHAGYRLKEEVKRLLDSLDLPWVDFGTDSEVSVDYPDIAVKVARAVASGLVDRGILVCGTGIGMAMAANKVGGIRAASVGDLPSARLSREHNDANVLTLGGRTTEVDRAREIVRTFLTTSFEGGRHQRRIDKVMALDAGNRGLSPSLPDEPAPGD